VLGIGANVAAFSVLYAVLTQPPKGMVADDTLIRIRGTAVSEGERETRYFAVPEVQAYERQQTLFEGVAAWLTEPVVLEPRASAEGVVSASAIFVDADYFDVLRVRPASGTLLGPADAAPAEAARVVIGHSMWQQYFGGSSDVVGRVLRVNDQLVEIAGVAPAGFAGAGPALRDRVIWLPLRTRTAITNAAPGWMGSWEEAEIAAVARLRPEATRDQALAVVRTIAASVPHYRESESEQTAADVAPLLAGNAEAPTSTAEATIQLVSAGVIGLLILLITCTTVSTLLVGLGVVRRREIAVRLSLGAGRARIVRQLLTENVLLALGACALALLVTLNGLRALASWESGLQFSLDWRVFIFAAVSAVVTALLFGLSPALHATRLALADVLKDGAASVASSRSWLQRGLVVAQIALTQPLLAAVGGTMLLVIDEMDGRAAGTDDERMMYVDFATVSGLATETQMAVLEEVSDRLRELPGVEAVTDRGGFIYWFSVAPHPADRIADRDPGIVPSRTQVAARDYFAAHGIPILAGRDFDTDDRHAGSNAVIIEERLARQLWAGASPLGRRIIRSDQADSVPLVVVGVAADAKSVFDEWARIYFPWTTQPPRSLLVRTAGPALSLLPTVRGIIQTEVRQMPLTDITTVAASRAEGRRDLLVGSTAVGVAGLIALLLFCIGLYAVVAFAVRQRTREIGIRTALGARRDQVVRMFVGGGLRLAGLGLVLGLPLSLLALRAVRGEIGTTAAEAAAIPLPVLAGTITGIVLSVSWLATWIPARHAAHVDPLTAVRVE
jgi:predicted permease